MVHFPTLTSQAHDDVKNSHALPDRERESVMGHHREVRESAREKAPKGLSLTVGSHSVS